MARKTERPHLVSKLQHIKEILFQFRKRLNRKLKIQGWRVKRLFVRTSLSRENSFQVPIIINNRNRCQWLKELVQWLRDAGYVNIVVLDNQSDYPPLLDYYKTTDVRVVRLDANLGYMALWQSEFFSEIQNSYYVYTDPDVLPAENCPDDIVFRLFRVLAKFSKIEKCGVALKIDDLPDHYDRKKEVVEVVEGQYWKHKVMQDVFDAPVDTTFALYRPFAYGNAENCPAYRLAGECVFRHRPWYENSSQLSPESLYYKQHASSSSTWYSAPKHK